MWDPYTVSDKVRKFGEPMEVITSIDPEGGTGERRHKFQHDHDAEEYFQGTGKPERFLARANVGCGHA